MSHPFILSLCALLSSLADDCKYYGWECVECGRRLTLTGLLVFVQPGKIAQVIAAAFIALAWLSLYGVLEPFVDVASDKASTIAQYMIFVQLFIAVLIKAGVIGEGARAALTALLITMNLVPPTMLASSLVGKATTKPPQVADEEEEPACEIQVADEPGMIELVSAEQERDDEPAAALEAPPAPTEQPSSLGFGFEVLCST